MDYSILDKMIERLPEEIEVISTKIETKYSCGAHTASTTTVSHTSTKNSTHSPIVPVPHRVHSTTTQLRS